MFHKGENPLVDSYSAFLITAVGRKPLDDWLRDHEIDELIVMGTATDYCVKFTVLDALQLGYKVNVITDGCRGVNIQPGTVRTRLWRCQQLGQRYIRWQTGKRHRGNFTLAYNSVLAL